MKCHICQQELVHGPQKFQFIPESWECPQLHALHIILDVNEQIVQYMIFVDDPEKNLRYRLESDNHETTLKQRILNSPIDKDFTFIEQALKRWSIIMTIKNFFPIYLNENQVIQVDNLIPRLLHLKAFS